MALDLMGYFGFHHTHSLCFSSVVSETWFHIFMQVSESAAAQDTEGTTGCNH